MCELMNGHASYKPVLADKLFKMYSALLNTARNCLLWKNVFNPMKIIV